MNEYMDGELVNVLQYKAGDRHIWIFGDTPDKGISILDFAFLFTKTSRLQLFTNIGYHFLHTTHSLDRPFIANY